MSARYLLPLTGFAHFGYLPARRMAGLSKLARVVEHFAWRLQVQWHLTTQVAGGLDFHLTPQGAGVVFKAEWRHGVWATGARAITRPRGWCATAA